MYIYIYRYIHDTMLYFVTVCYILAARCVTRPAFRQVPDLERMYRLFCRVPQTLKEVQRAAPVRA